MLILPILILILIEESDGSLTNESSSIQTSHCRGPVVKKSGWSLL